MPINASVAQLAERCIRNAQVAGSNPAGSFQAKRLTDFKGITAAAYSISLNICFLS